MNTTKWLSILLSISLGANLWFLWNRHQQNSQKPYTPNPPISASSTNTAVDQIKHSWMDPQVKETNNTQAEKNEALLSFDSNDIQTKEEYFQYISALAKAREFDILEFEVAKYLRLYPDDNNAMLLEAQAYYHTKPLNIALVHYHELLTKPLNNLQITEIEKLIAVNTTRVIQQFSGDGAWDLLATFLEPLVQIDPLNRQYLLALARSYGMQEQFTLMEDVLANFPADDPRANRLRDNVIARLNQEEVDDPLIDSLVNMDDFEPTDKRKPDLVLQQQRGQFIAQARVSDTPVNLLVDTGASTTAISDRVIAMLPAREKEFLGKFAINTAGGRIQAPIYKVSSLQLGFFPIRNTSVLVLPDENLSQFDGLLGMNILSQYDLAYDANTQTLKLYRKR